MVGSLLSTWTVHIPIIGATLYQNLVLRSRASQWLALGYSLDILKSSKPESKSSTNWVEGRVSFPVSPTVQHDSSGGARKATPYSMRLLLFLAHPRS